MLARNTNTVIANGRSYRMPGTPTVVVCIDGSEPGYIEAAVAAGLAPNMDRLLRTGSHHLAHAVIPSFTNPNNISIITGRPPAVHGIAGNYFYDRETGEEVMMNDVRFMRTGTIMQAFEEAGAKVAVVTAKDKLRTLLGNGLDYEKWPLDRLLVGEGRQGNEGENGIDDLLKFVGLPLPEVYSADLSEFVFAAGVKLVKTFRPDVMYLSTTDYVQHKAGPGSDIANAFYAMMDRYIGELDALGCVVALTADHGMNDKHLASGEPDVLYLQDWMDRRLGTNRARVILPITDPYVAHHGALGSFATIYLPSEIDQKALLAELAAVEGVETALDSAATCARFGLPADRIGDLVVISTQHKVLGTSAARHDLTGLTEPLRSHGGLTEQVVPMIVNRAVTWPTEQLRNFDVFDVALNRVAA